MTLSCEEIARMLTAPGQQFEIEELEIDGRRIKSWKNAPRNMADILRASARHGDADFIVFQGERWTYREHYGRATALARKLVNELGIGKGDRVAIAMRNYPEWVCAFWAAAAAGAVVVPLNAWWTTDELEYGLNDSGAKLVFVDRERLQRLQPIREAVSGLQYVVGVRCEGSPGEIIPFDQLVAGASTELDLPAVDIATDDNATLFYTSGTTGFPKGTLGTHRNFCSVALTAPYISVLSLLRMGGSLQDLAAMAATRQAALLTVPLFHVTGCHGIMLSMLNTGGKLVVMYKWDPAEALNLIEGERVTLFGGVPTMIWQLLDEPDIEQRDLSSVLNVGYGGAPAAPEILRRIRSKLPGSGASNGWGITETSSAVTMIGGQDYMDRPDSVGPTVPVCEVRVVNESGAEQPPGELGELWVRGPNVVRGYWNKPEATAAAFTDGWFHTGDVGKVDEEGFVYIVDRLKDMIIRGGENIYCAEVEAILLEHPAVKAACVFGTPHQVLGEEVAAVVQVAERAAVDEEALRQHVAGRLARFKVPARIWIRTEPLPVGATGKVQKNELKEQYRERVAN